MEENKEQLQPELQEDSSQSSPAEDISLGDAMAGVFSEPGDTFTAVKQSTKKNYWLVPLLIVIAVSILSSFLVMQDEELSSAINDKQTAAMKEQLDKAVKEGNMTREQADQQIEQSQKFMSGGMMMVFAVLGAVFGTLIIFFLKALLLWGGAKIFKGTASYINVMNVLGLAGLITAIQLIVDTVLAIVMGKLMVNIGPILLFTEEALGKSMYAFVANFDLINIWYMIIAGIGLAKVSDLKYAVTIPLVFGLWLVWVLLTSFGPLGMFVGK